MAASPHRIRRQRWTVKAGSAGEAFALRQHLRGLWTEELLPIFDRAFDEAASGARTIYVPKLVLSLRLASPDFGAGKLPELIYRQLREQLRARLETQPPAADDGRPSADAAVADPFDTLLRYLRIGSLPWPAIRESSRDTTRALREACQQHRARLLEHLRTHDEPADFQFRLFQFFSESDALEFVEAAAERLNPDWRLEVVQVLAVLLASSPAILGRYTQLRLLAAILSASLTASQTAIPHQLAEIPEAVLTDTEQAAFGQILRSLPDSAARLFHPRAESHEAIRANGQAAVPGAFRQPLADSRASLIPSGDDGPAMPRPEPSTAQAAATPAPFAGGAVEEGFATLVHYAGLILLHPYLPRFLQAIGVNVLGEVEPSPEPTAGPLTPFLSPGGRECARRAGEGAPATPREIARAAAALHFLATGREELFEHELGFIKVLLGLRPEQPLPVAEGLLDPKTKVEAEALLQSVIRHWTALKNTSVAGLRESFLNRPGLLRETASGWKLQLERRPFDVLLDQLPWTFGVAKLTWMPLPLFTEW